MPWNKNDYPVSMKNLSARVRNKAVDIANALLDEGYEEGRAIAIATAQAEKWDQDHPEDKQADHSHAKSDSHQPEHSHSHSHPSKNRDSESSAGSSHANMHVVATDDGWALKKEGRDKPLSTFDTKKEAVAEAKKQASKSGVNTIIHGEDGRIQTNMSS